MLVRPRKHGLKAIKNPAPDKYNQAAKALSPKRVKNVLNTSTSFEPEFEAFNHIRTVRFKTSRVLNTFLDVGGAHLISNPQRRKRKRA